MYTEVLLDPAVVSGGRELRAHAGTVFDLVAHGVRGAAI